MSAGQIWSRYVRYIGAGAVAAAGHRHRDPRAADDGRLVRGRARAACAGRRRAPRRRGGPRTDRDLPGWVVVVGGPSLVVLRCSRCPACFGGNMSAGPRLRGGARRGHLRPRVRGRVVAHRRPHRRLVAADVRHDAGDAARRVGRVRGAGLDRPGRARRGAHRRHHRLRRGVEGGRHLAGPEDGLPGRAPRRRGSSSASSSAPRSRAGRSPGPCCSSARLHVRLPGAAGAAGDPDEDRHRRRPGGRPAVGPRPHGRRAALCAMLCGPPGPRLRDRRLPAARHPDPDLRRRHRAPHRRAGAPVRRRRATPASWPRRA